MTAELAARPAPAEPTAPSRRRRFAALVRAHWLLSALLVLGLALRVLTWLAYQPALLYTDSFYYLGNVGPLNPQYLDPIGYPLLVLKPLLPLGGLRLVSGVQHLAGIGMALLIYPVALRAGRRRWLAALATAPILLDGYQLQIEQNILSDVWLEVLLAVAAFLLLRRGVPGWRAAAFTGLVLGAAITVRMVAIALIVPALVYVLVAGRHWRLPGGWRRIAARSGALVLVFAAVVFSYAAYFHSKTGYWGLNTASGNSIYGRTAVVADCPKLNLSPAVAQLCPAQPLGQRYGSDNYAHMDGTPGWPGPIPPGQTVYDLERQFAKAVIIHQPLDVAGAVLNDFGKGFTWPRQTYPGDPPADNWRFQDTYPIFPLNPPYEPLSTSIQVTHDTATQYGGVPPSANPTLATIMRDYQGVMYTPGPALAAFGLLGLLGGVGVGRARRSGLRTACLVTTGLAVTVLGTAALFEFSWRYQLPGLVLLPLAGALGLAALLGPRKLSAGRPG